MDDTQKMILLLLLLLAPPSFDGQVIKITDGDTIHVLVDQRPRKVRLEEIDAPEKGQAFGSKAREALLQLTPIGSTVTVEQTGTDRYGRTLGVVFAAGTNVNEQLVRDGFAWHFTRYSSDTRLSELEAKARAARRGLWQEPEPVPPWEFRRRKLQPAQ